MLVLAIAFTWEYQCLLVNIDFEVQQTMSDLRRKLLLKRIRMTVMMMMRMVIVVAVMIAKMVIL